MPESSSLRAIDLESKAIKYIPKNKVMANHRGRRSREGGSGYSIGTKAMRKQCENKSGTNVRSTKNTLEPSTKNHRTNEYKANWQSSSRGQVKCEAGFCPQRWFPWF